MRPIGRPFANVKMIDERRRRTARASGRFGTVLSTRFPGQFSAPDVIMEREGKNVGIISMRERIDVAFSNLSRRRREERRPSVCTGSLLFIRERLFKGGGKALQLEHTSFLLRGSPLDFDARQLRDPSDPSTQILAAAPRVDSCENFVSHARARPSRPPVRLGISFQPHATGSQRRL